MRLALIVLACLGALGCDAIYALQRSALFRPGETQPRPELAEELVGLERWWIDVDGGRVEAWYLPPLARPAAGRAPAVIFAHGNQELIEDWAVALAPYRAMGLAVLLPEYRGYGRSGGEPSELAIVEDYTQFHDRLVDRPEIDGARVVFHGRSLGGGVIGALADRRRPAALVLESTFTNLPDLASRWWAPMGAVADRFDTRDVLTRSSTPTLILHGVDDERIPFRHAAELHRVAWDSELIAYRAGHDDLPRTEEAYWSRVRAFLAESGVRPTPARPAGASPGAAR